jgi:hypothetical protein
MAKHDWQFVKEILDRSKGKGSEAVAREVAKALGKRIRQRGRDREDFSQAALRTVREATERV